MQEYGEVLSTVTGMVDKDLDDWKVMMVKATLLQSFESAKKVYGFPADAVPEIKGPNIQPSFALMRHDGADVDYDDPALTPYYSGEGDLPPEYYHQQRGWRVDYGWYYVHED